MDRKILLNYRRADTKGYAVAIYNSLISNFGKDQIFMDIDAIEPGADFVKVLEKAVQQCDVLIVLIGPQWLEIKDNSGERRLDNKGDFVRIEIKAALERDIAVLPILVQDAKMPSAQNLPDDIRSLARRQSFVISDRFSTDVKQLIEVLNRILEKAKQKRLEKEKAEKKKLTDPGIETSKPVSIAPKQSKKVAKSAPVKAEVKQKTAEKARGKTPDKPSPRITRWIPYALTAAAISVGSYILFTNMDIFTKISEPTEDIAISLPIAAETPAVEYPVSDGLSSVNDEIKVIHASNIDQIIELVRWDDEVIRELAYSPVEDLIAVATSFDIHILQIDQADGNYELNKIRTIHFDSALNIEFTRTHLSISPDGSMLATSHEDGNVRLWQVSDGELLHTMGKSNSSSGAVAFSPDGNTLAFYLDGLVQLHQVSDGKQVNIFRNNSNIRSIAFSPDGSILATGRDGTRVQLMQVSDARPLEPVGTRNFDSHDLGNIVAFSPDGSILASGHEDGTVRLWQLSGRDLLETLSTKTGAERGWISSLTFSPDGSMLAVGYERGPARIWRTSDWEVLKDLEDINDGSVLSVSFSRDGNLFATSSIGGAIRLFRVSDWEEVTNKSWNSAGIGCIALSPDKSMIASGSEDGIVRLWQVSSRSLLNKLESESKNAISSVAYSPDGNLLAVGQDDGVQLLRISDKVWLNSIKTSGYLNSVVFSPDGSMLASGARNGTVQIWQVIDGTLISTLKGDGHDVLSVAFSPDGSTLAAGDDEGTVRLWRVSDGVFLSKAETPPDLTEGWMSSLSFTPDGEVFFCNGKNLLLWDTEDTEENLLPISGWGSSMSCMVLSSDGTLLVTGSPDSTIQIWGVVD